MKKANFNKKKLNLSKKTILFLNEKSLSFMQGGTGTTGKEGDPNSTIPQACGGYKATKDPYDIKCKSKLDATCEN